MYQALGLGDLPEGKLTGYGRLTKLFTSTNLDIIEARVKTAIATRPDLPVPPAQPWPWFVELFLGAVNRPWEYERKHTQGFQPPSTDHPKVGGTLDKLTKHVINFGTLRDYATGKVITDDARFPVTLDEQTGHVISPDDGLLHHIDSGEVIADDRFPQQ